MSCVSHRIKESVLKEILLTDIREQAENAVLNRSRMRELLIRQTGCGDPGGAPHKDAARRLAELNDKAAKLYEDRVTGVITADTFTRLLGETETERETLENRMAELESSGAERKRKIADIELWLDAITSRPEIEDVDRALLDELVERIEVGAVTKKESGEKRRDVSIYYSFDG